MEKVKKIRFLWLRICLSAVLICAGVLLTIFESDIGKFFLSKDLQAIESSAFQMYVVDIGQGDAIYLQFDDGKNMLVDTGEKSEYEKLSSFLTDKKVTTIDYLIYTHADADHIGGGVNVFRDYQVNTLYRPTVLSTSEVEEFGNAKNYEVKDTITYNNSIMCAYQEVGCNIIYSKEGEKIESENYSIKFLNPDQEKCEDSNAYSAVLMIESFGKKVLLTGDAEKEVEQRLIKDYDKKLDADILKVGHHGSKTATTFDFLSRVTPDYALISIGEKGKKQWEFPNEEVLTNLQKANVKQVLQTLEVGTICVGITENSQIIVAGKSGEKSIDLPVVLSVIFVLILLVWGIKPFVKKTKKK